MATVSRLTKRPVASAEDERAIQHLLLRYATGIDTRDWQLFRSCFTADCELDYGTFGRWRGPRELTKDMEAMHRDLGATLHRISNIVVEQCDGETLARSYVDVVLMDPANGGERRAAGFYDDRLTRTSEGWQISRRKFTMVSSS